MNQKKLTFTVGEEKKLRDVISEQDVMPLLQGAVKAGALEADILDAENRTLWLYRGPVSESSTTATLPLTLEGEVVGAVAVKGRADNIELLNNLAGLLRDTLAIIIRNNLKRLFATELHTTVVNQSYEELLETNARLRASEEKYRELAETLERKVVERTNELHRAHARLLQQEKMASVGQLAAGVAHELNTPLGYIASNLNSLRKYLNRLNDMLLFYDKTVEKLPESGKAAVREKRVELKVDFILSDGIQLIEQSLAGTERAAGIVSGLKDFSHVDDAATGPVDINQEIDKTLNVMAHQLPADARIIKRYAPVPPLICNPALLCQVFLNMIQNALQAKSEGLELCIATSHSPDQGIVIRFADNGPGVPPDIRQRIFEPFFTTKDVGKGTGMGLTVVYESVTSLGGSIRLDDTQGGASFTITLPGKEARHAEIR